MQLTNEIEISLKREYTLCSNAIAFYKKALSEFEREYHISTPAFLKKFESGQIGDDAAYFDWYAFSKLLYQWEKTKSALRSTIR